MALKRALRLHYVATFTSAGLATLYSDRVPVGETWCIQRYAFEGSSTPSGGNTRTRVLIDGPGERPPQSEVDAPSAATLYWDDQPVYLHEHERLALEWDQAQANAQLDLWLTGYRMED